MNTGLIIKIISGIFIIPFSILAHEMWPLWTGASNPVKIISSPIVLPIAGIAAIVTPWWDDL